MATRLYLPASGNAPVNFNGSATHWNNQNANNPNNQHATSVTPSNTALASRTLAEAVASVINQQLKMFVSDPLDAQSLSGNFTSVIKATESTATADDALQIVIRVMSLDGQTQRAVLYAGQTTALSASVGALGEEHPTTAATRIFPSTALSSYTCVDGDRLSIEYGYRSYDVSGTSASSTLNFGDPVGTADFALTSGLTTNLRPWIEFATNIEFLKSDIRIPRPVSMPSVTRASAW